MEGNAPSLEMRGAFQRFRAWLVGAIPRRAARRSSITMSSRGQHGPCASAPDLRRGGRRHARAPQRGAPRAAPPA
jgi:hypothetical protein